MLWSAICFETLLLWMCCPWIAFLVIFPISSRFRRGSLDTYLGCLMTCIPLYGLYIIFITPLQSSLSFDIPILLSVLSFYLIVNNIKHCPPVVWRKRDWLKIFALVIYLISGLTTLLSLSWMGL